MKIPTVRHRQMEKNPMRIMTMRMSQRRKRILSMRSTSMCGLLRSMRR